ncbi:MAG TPA: dihydrodipicolinate synthase family protein [Hyphomicrobiaceae bacterium]
MGENEVDVRGSLTGVLPPVVTPFDKAGNIDFGCLREQIDFIVEAGCTGIVIGGSTGEGHTLNSEDFCELMEAAHEALNGRGSLLAGLIVNSTKEAIDRLKRIEGMKVDALQVTPVHYLFKPGPDATVSHFKKIAEHTPVPLLIYNVIQWNYLSVDLMLRIMDEVPGVIGMKQSNGDLKSVSDLLLRKKSENVVLTGIDGLLYPAFMLGVDGAITALTAAVPGLVVKLWKAVQNGDHRQAREIHFRLAKLWNSMTHDNLPACTKYVQHRQGLKLSFPRAPMEEVSAEQKRSMDAALDEIGL